MNMRQRKHRLNVRRRGEARWPWCGAKYFNAISHSVRDWSVEFGCPLSNMQKHNLIPGEIGRFESFRFITSGSDHEQN